MTWHSLAELLLNINYTIFRKYEFAHYWMNTVTVIIKILMSCRRKSLTFPFARPNKHLLLLQNMLNEHGNLSSNNPWNELVVVSFCRITTSLILKKNYLVKRCENETFTHFKPENCYYNTSRVQRKVCPKFCSLVWVWKQ